ncbi:hypothetical protein FACS18949_05810 [Clostridia bacterium]|nr:hypothetical protein FACS18949_05810 [Clostridia bacterium]
MKRKILTLLLAITLCLPLFPAIAAAEPHEFLLTITARDGTLTELPSGAQTLGAALLAAELISGDVTDYGLYVKFVNGREADYDLDGSYWSFYVNGGYAQSGIDATDIRAGDKYELIKSDEDFAELTISAAVYPSAPVINPQTSGNSLAPLALLMLLTSVIGAFALSKAKAR